MSYVDLHSHLLPAVDDGARDLQESLRYARRLTAEGVREVVATPHVKLNVALDLDSIGPRVAELQRALDAEHLPVCVHAGGELHPACVSRLGDRELELVAQGPPGRRWVLLEAPFAGLDDDFTERHDELGQRGFGVLVAHPERARGILDDDAARLRGLLRAGAVAQVNVCSLLGQHGLAVQEAAAAILRRGLAHVLASDAHPGSRGHTLRLGFELAMGAGASSVQAWRLTQGHPRAMLREGVLRERPAPRLAA